MGQLKGRERSLGRKDDFFSIHKKIRGGAERGFGCDPGSPKSIMEGVMLVSLVGQQSLFDDADKVFIS